MSSLPVPEQQQQQQDIKIPPPGKTRRIKNSRLKRLQTQSKSVPRKESSFLAQLNEADSSVGKLIDAIDGNLKQDSTHLIAQQKKGDKTTEKLILSLLKKNQQSAKQLKQLKQSYTTYKYFKATQMDAVMARILVESAQLPKTNMHWLDIQGLITTPHQEHVALNAKKFSSGENKPKTKTKTKS